MTRLEIIAAEVNGDPAGVGYMAPGENGDVTTREIADRMNEPRPGQTVELDSVPSDIAAAAIDLAEFAAATAVHRAYLQLLLTPPTVRIKSVKDYLLTIFGPGSVSRTRLQALLTRTASRAEILGLGHVTTQEVGLALNR